MELQKIEQLRTVAQQLQIFAERLATYYKEHSDRASISQFTLESETLKLLIAPVI